MTNAAKHGALSEPGGKLHVQWHVEDQQLQLSWQERCNHSVRKPESYGMGTRLMRGLIEYELQGQLTHTWRPDGLTVDLVIPLTKSIT